MSFFGFGQSADIDIHLDGQDARKKVEVKTEDGKKELMLLYYDGETVSGKVNVSLKKAGSKLEHQGIKIEFIGQIELFYDRGNHHEFTSLVKELARPGEMIAHTSYPFEFSCVEKPFEVYTGCNVRLRYFLKVTIVRRLADVVKELDIAVHTLSSYPEMNNSIKMEVGIEDCLHIEFEYNKSKYHLKDVIVGKIYFLLVRIKIKHMEIAIIKRETTGSGPNMFTENETIAKYEIMDGAPVRGESIPIRVFLAGYELTPTMRDINKKFSVRYFLNLVLMDTEDRRYFKQQEITLWRKGDKVRKANMQQVQGVDDVAETNQFPQMVPHLTDSSLHNKNENENESGSENKQEVFTEIKSPTGDGNIGDPFSVQITINTSDNLEEQYNKPEMYKMLSGSTDSSSADTKNEILFDTGVVHSLQSTPEKLSNNNSPDIENAWESEDHYKENWNSCFSSVIFKFGLQRYIRALLIYTHLMDLVGVQFSQDGGLAVVHEKWLTPRKTEVYWPPCKQQHDYDKLLKCGDEPKHHWQLFSISKLYFESDNFEVARKKIKKLEFTSDIQSDEDCCLLKRKRTAPLRFSHGSSTEDEYVNPKKSSNLKLPPRINLDSLDSEIPTSVNNEPLVTLSRKSQNDSGDIASSCGMPSTFTTAQYDRKLITLLACCVFTTCLGKHQELSTLFLQIKKQNNQILAWIRSQSTVALVPRSLPEKFPVSFPLRNNSYVEELENYIALKENLDSLAVFLSSLGGRDVNNRVNVILRYVFDDRLASTYNFCGKRSNKTAIKDLHLRKAVIDSIKRVSTQTTEKEIDSTIKNWLKHAPERVKLSQRCSTSNLNDDSDVVPACLSDMESIVGVARIESTAVKRKLSDIRDKRCDTTDEEVVDNLDISSTKPHMTTSVSDITKKVSNKPAQETLRKKINLFQHLKQGTLV
ncbi:hypothetical protein RN001_011263 [Aquatica leii]|uniref:Vacuolar protein sorting-associated protein 26 n=1 Tax=Aquatica leii TaxID=1421715 RepID=A0AAN7P7P0_9COLE|nr:hypothetical protein RN001_011263 [Aquatica leii]